MIKKIFVLLISLFIEILSSFQPSFAKEPLPTLSTDNLLELSLVELMQVTAIETASGVEESLAEASATLVVVTAEDIRQRGYTDLTEVIADLPGFDVIFANGTSYMMAYQRGYRTPYTSRTLLMIDGIVDNELWSQEAVITRQYPLSNIQRIEVLYGPAGAVYGPNAFLGIINIITRDAAQLQTGAYRGEVNALLGSYQSKGLDMLLQAKPLDDLSLSLSYKSFNSDEPDLTGKFGFLEQRWFTDETIWGPLLQLEHEGRQFGEYYDPTDDYGVLADANYQAWKLGLIHWRRKEAFGPYYAADHAQNNAFWNKSSDQLYLEYTPQLTDKLKTHTLLRYRESRRYGLWAEAEPDWQPGMEDYSYVSFTHWNTENSSWLFRQDFDFQLKDNLTLSGGIKYERKTLTKAYDVPGYWDSAISSSIETGAGIVHSSEPNYIIPPPPAAMPADNLAHTYDKGLYLQGIYNWQRYRLTLGLRYDNNSMYGGVFNPRASFVFQQNKHRTFKLLYGEAFQEPAPLQLWGGWSGRQANPDLKPEKARTLEGVVMHQHQDFTQEASLYYAHYQDVIKEEAENAGTRDIYGLEYRAKTELPAIFDKTPVPLLDFNYTYTHTQSSIHYDHTIGAWQSGDAILGDIAPHKFNIGLNLPLPNEWNFNLRGQFVSARTLYLRNPLRDQGKKINSYFTLNSALTYHYDPFDITLKVKNLLNEEYFHPGVELANSGNDFTQRAQGYQNSLIPQPGRSWWLNFRWRFDY